MTCGIYMIQNTTNGKIYIGQAIDIEKRWKRHVWELDNNKHTNKHLQRAWNKDKKENFKFGIICECEENQLNTLEQYCIFELMTYNGRVGYNKTYGGGSGKPTKETKEKIRGKNHPMYGKHISEEHKKKLIESSKNRIVTEETRKKLRRAGMKEKNSQSKKVMCIETEEIFPCIREAERKLGVANQHISDCCKGKQKTAGGYHWKYID